MHYLYKIKNNLNSKVYIGQTMNVVTRWSAHKSYVRTKKRKQYIHHAMEKYGIQNFSFEVLAAATNQENANELETLLIVQYNSLAPNGYNITKGGNNAPMPESARRKLSQALKGNKNGLGYRHTEEMKKHLREINKGKKISEETKQKISEANKEQKAWNKGIPMSEKSKQKLIASNIGREPWNKDKTNIYSEKTLNKLSESHKGQLPWNTRYFPEEFIEEIRALYKNGISMRKISQMYNINKKIVKRLITQGNYPQGSMSRRNGE